MFDSLSAVAEITGVDYDKWLSDLYANDEVRRTAGDRRRTGGPVTRAHPSRPSGPRQ